MGIRLKKKKGLAFRLVTKKITLLQTGTLQNWFNKGFVRLTVTKCVLIFNINDYSFFKTK